MDEWVSDQSIQAQRTFELGEIIKDFQPQIVLLDYFPFGRIKCKPEIDFVISFSRFHGVNSVFTIMRDIYTGVPSKDLSASFQAFSDTILPHTCRSLAQSSHFHHDMYVNIYKHIIQKGIPESFFYNMLIESYCYSGRINGVLVF